MPLDNITESTSVADISASIGSDLFPEPSSQSNESDATSPNSGGERQQVAQPSDPNAPANIGGEQTPAPVQRKALPKAWKKTMEPLWNELKPELHDYVYSREDDVMKGLQMYQDGHTKWTETITPFKQVLDQHPNVNPVQLMQNVMGNHIRLLQTPPQERIALAKKLLEGYGIPIEALTGQPAQAPDATQRELQELRAEVQRLQGGFQTAEQRLQQQAVAEKTKEVEKFFSDPANKYAEELGDNIFQLLKTGAASDLPTAYEMAMWTNPEVRAKVLAEQQAAAAGKPPGPKPTNIDESGEAKPRTRAKAKSWQADVDEIVSKAYATSTH